MNKRKKRTLFICEAAIIAALYVALTWLSTVLGLSSGAIQCRFSEALCVLPYFTASAIPGLGIGCLISNIMASGNPFDIAFGTLATVLGALGTYALRKLPVGKWLASAPTIVSNTLIIPFVLRFTYTWGVENSIYYYMLTVGIGEVISAGFFGMALLFALEPHKKRIFYTQNGKK